MSSDLKRISAGVSLVMLALGFSLLGILSFMNRLQGELATGSALEKNCCLAGGAGSLWQGRCFLLLPVFTGAVGGLSRRRRETIRETRGAFDEGGGTFGFERASDPAPSLLRRREARSHIDWGLPGKKS
jgi:hypothetical protein